MLFFVCYISRDICTFSYKVSAVNRPVASYQSYFTFLVLDEKGEGGSSISSDPSIGRNICSVRERLVGLSEIESDGAASKLGFARRSSVSRRRGRVLVCLGTGLRMKLPRIALLSRIAARPLAVAFARSTNEGAFTAASETPRSLSLYANSLSLSSLSTPYEPQSNEKKHIFFYNFF